MSYFPKLIELDELSIGHEPTVQLVRMGEFNKLAHVKTASEALDYIKNVKAIPGKTVILVLAMTAGEIYGPNRNGDAWPEKPLLVAGKTRITEDDVLPKHYKSFETNAHVFKHHINKDPARSVGQVLKAFYNWPMHRVELLLALDNVLAEDAVQEIESGKYPAVSMGCKVKYDTCSICGNNAPSRKEYCDHAKYQLGETLSNGKRVFVWNPSPKFFDISIVRRPADRLGFMMKKVAETIPEIRSSAVLGEYIDNLQTKNANLRKLSLISKIINGEVGATKEQDGDLNIVKNFADQVAIPVANNMPEFDDNTIRQMLAYKPAEVLSTLASMGILVTTPEFIKHFVWSVDPTIRIPEKALANAVAMQSQIFEVLANNPQLLEEINETGVLNVSTENINQELLKKMSSWLEKRSTFSDYINRRLPESWRGGDKRRGNWDVLEGTDPNTGRRFATTRWAANIAEDEAIGRRSRNLLGGGAMLAAGGMLGAVPFVGPMLMAGGAGRIYQGVKGYPTMRADTGETFYGRSYAPLTDRRYAGTELVEKRSSDLSRNSAAVIKLAMDARHYRRAANMKIVLAEDATFDQAAEIIGRAICL